MIYVSLCRKSGKLGVGLGGTERMAVGDEVKGHCPTCSGEKFAKVVTEHEDHWDDEDVSGIVRLSVLQCGGCKTSYFQRAESCSDDVEHREEPDGSWEAYYPERKTYWPAPSKRKKPDWSHELYVDKDLSDLYDELYIALNSDLRVLAAIGVRTILDKMSELLGIDPAMTFDEKLDGLVKNGSIGADERKNLAALADAGGAAAHRGWRPTPQQLDTLVSTLEAFLYRAVVLGDAMKAVKEAVPEKQKRRPA